MNPLHEAWKATLRALRPSPPPAPKPLARTPPAPAPAPAKPESPWDHVGKRG